MDPKKLKKENKRLSKALSEKDKALLRAQRENARLKRKISQLKGVYGEEDNTVSQRRNRKKGTETDRQCAELIHMGQVNARRFSKKSYFRYLIQSVKDSALGFYIRRITHYIRRLRLIRTIATILSVVMVTLLLSAFFITLLPVLLICITVTLLAACIRAKEANRIMREALTDRRIRVIILSDKVSFLGNSFIERSAMAMAQEKDTAVILVSPYLLSSRGPCGKKMFFTVREEVPHLYIVRRGYYFILRRRILDTMSDQVTILY